MKNTIVKLSAVIIAFSLMAFGYINWNSPNIPEGSNKVEDDEFYYDLGPRFDPVKKADLANATSIYDFLDEEQAPPAASFESVTLIVIENERRTDIRVSGKDDKLTDQQLDFLNAAGYSTHFSVRGDYKGINPENGNLENMKFNPHLTIVPETQASYLDGAEALLKYIRTSNKENLPHLEQDKLRPAKLYFTVQKDGAITNVHVDNTSGYHIMDKAMVKYLIDAPGSWIPARNAKGEKVDQELVITFSLKGC